ncbi:MAG TPA: PspC domain-containing protein [bacterium]
MAEEKREKTTPGSRSTRSEPEAPRRVYRSKADRMIAGVCAGVAQYFNIDPLIIRIAWALAFLAGGTGLVAYVAAWIIIPEKPEPEDSPKKPERKTDSGMVWGLVLIAIGGLLLFQRMSWFDFYPNWSWSPLWFRDFDAGMILPVILILVGIVYITTISRQSQDTANAQEQKSTGGSAMAKKLTRSVSDKMIGGVCGGVAKYFSIDPSIVRIVWAVVTFANPVVGGLFYIVMLIVVPEEAAVQSTTGSKAATSKAKAK